MVKNLLKLLDSTRRGLDISESKIEQVEKKSKDNPISHRNHTIEVFLKDAYEPTKPVSVQLQSYLSRPSIHVPLFKHGAD